MLLEEEDWEREAVPTLRRTGRHSTYLSKWRSWNERERKKEKEREEGTFRRKERKKGS